MAQNVILRFEVSDVATASLHARNDNDGVLLGALHQHELEDEVAFFVDFGDEAVVLFFQFFEQQVA